jgi:2',3'-cyclic-nucleotide 2'-phosphodiesterase (5'-nucleotidase family)
MIRLALLLTISFISGACRAEPRQLVIFHTNDIHGHFVAEHASWRKDSALVGGIAALEGELSKLRAQYPHSLYLDAGDLMTGNPVCSIEYRGVRGGALLEMLSRLEVTAECLGNHEFDLGAQHLREYVAASPYPVLCANVRDKNGTAPLAAAVCQVSENGIRVGIIGLILDDLKDVVAKATIQDFVVNDAAATAQKYIDDLDPVTDVIILLTHMGADADSVLATRIHDADVIVGGHSHTRLAEPKRVNHVIIVQAGSYCKNLGVLELSIAGDSVSAYSGHLEELDYDEHSPRTALAAFADSLDGEIHARYGQVIGELAEQWTPGYYHGSNVGNWICDRLRERYHADMAVINAGGIRTSLNAGPISMLDVLSLLPFENSVTTFEATGADLATFAGEQARAQGLEKHGALEMSGLTVSYRKQGDRVDVVDTKVNGSALDSLKTYHVVSIDYVSVSQADRYLGFLPRHHESTDLMLSEFVMNEIKAATAPVHADSVPRLQEVK